MEQLGATESEDKLRILYIGNPFNKGGWSNAAELHIRELSKHHDVIVRHINVGQGYRSISDIEELTKKPLGNFDCTIQATLPNLSYVDKRIPLNYIVYFVESDRIPPSWTERINSFDGAIVSCEAARHASIRSGVNVPMYINHIKVKKPSIVSPNQVRDRNPSACWFYTVADCNPRKNLQALIMAFHNEFRPDEEVELFIKVSETAEQSASYINQMSEQIKQGLRLYPVDRYKKESIIYGYISDEQMASLHAAGDIFVNTSLGEAFSIPTIEAALLGKYLVVPKHSCFLDHFNNDNAWMVESESIPCFGANAPQDLHDGSQNWWRVHVNSLRRQMRASYTAWQNNRIKPVNIQLISWNP